MIALQRTMCARGMPLLAKCKPGRKITTPIPQMSRLAG